MPPSVPVATGGHQAPHYPATGGVLSIMARFRSSTCGAWPVLLVLLVLPVIVHAQEAALLESPAATSELSSLVEEFRLLRWAPALPPPEWKCWGMGNGARDWRHGDLHGCHMFMAHEAAFNGEDIRDLTTAILANGTELVSVDLAGSDLMSVDGTPGVEAIGEMLSAPLGLEQVNLENNGFGPADSVVLGKAISGKACPTRLRFGWNTLGSVGAKALADGLASGESGLRELSLEKNALGDAGAEYFGSALALNPRLHTLNLDGNQIGPVGAEAIGRMFAANNRFLWRLSLRDNMLGPAGMRALIPTASEMKLAAVGDAGRPGRSSALSSLDLHGNNAGDEGCFALASLLESSLLGSLTQLGLSSFSCNNGITDEGAKALAAAISGPKSRIMTLQLANNKIGESGAVALLSAARQSGTLVSLDLRGNAAAMRARTAQPNAFKEEFGCNLLLIHGLGPNWPEQSSAKTQDTIDAALQNATAKVEDILRKWAPGQYRLGPSKNTLPKNHGKCVAKASRLLKTRGSGRDEF